MSAKFNMVKIFYARGQWDQTKVWNAVIKGWITEEEYYLITGDTPTEQVDTPTE